MRLARFAGFVLALWVWQGAWRFLSASAHISVSDAAWWAGASVGMIAVSARVRRL